MRPPPPPPSETAALDAVPAPLARRLRVLPLALEDGVLHVAADGPVDGDELDILRVGAGVIAVEVTELPGAGARQLVVAGRRTLGPALVGSSEPDTAPDAVAVLDAVLDVAVGLDASDVHLEAVPAGLRIRLRRDGALRELGVIVADLRDPVVARAKVRAGLDVAERRAAQDGRLGHPVPDGEVDIRVATLPTRHGERVTLRVLPRGAVTTVERLGLPAPVGAALRSAGAASDGLIVLCGPTGSGKTTTLHALLGGLADGTRAVMTIEDPVERQVLGTTQTQVDPSAGLTFAAGMRHLLRHDPDVLLVGEVRDAETAALALEAARTGHLVLTTLHAVDAPGALDRLDELGIAPERIAGVLRLIVAQRLLALPCPDCAATGCPACDGTGTRGRSAVAEAIVWDAGLRTAVLTARDPATRRQVLHAACRPRLREVALARAAAGRALATEARIATPEPDP